MRLAQPAILMTLVMLGLAWGACLVIIGLFAIGMSDPARPLESPLLWLGIAGIAAGNFVFMEIVADRLIDAPRRRALDLTELASVSVMILSLLAAATLWFQSSLG